MGLLDDAIREHLDLRRRHGADPDEVAREELDALAPVPRDGNRDRQQPAADERERALFDGEHVAERVVETDEASGSGAATMMQETAEIDMRSILDDGGIGDSASWIKPERDRLVERVVPGAAGVQHSTFAAEVDGDPLAWEAPAPRVRRVERRTSVGQASGGELSAEASAP